MLKLKSYRERQNISKMNTLQGQDFGWPPCPRANPESPFSITRKTQTVPASSDIISEVVELKYREVDLDASDVI